MPAPCPARSGQALAPLTVADPSPAVYQRGPGAEARGSAFLRTGRRVRRPAGAGCAGSLWHPRAHESRPPSSQGAARGPVHLPVVGVPGVMEQGPSLVCLCQHSQRRGEEPAVSGAHSQPSCPSCWTCVSGQSPGLYSALTGAPEDKDKPPDGSVPPWGWPRRGMRSAPLLCRRPLTTLRVFRAVAGVHTSCGCEGAVRQDPRAPVGGGVMAQRLAGVPTECEIPRQHWGREASQGLEAAI